MSEVVVIIGLPGSGKTHLAQSLPFARYWHLDGPTCSCLALDLLRQVRDGVPVVIVTVDFYTHFQQEVLVQAIRGANPKATIRWIAFENDPRQARTNAQQRGDYLENDLWSMAAVYQIPEGAQVLPVWRPPEATELPTDPSETCSPESDIAPWTVVSPPDLTKLTESELTHLAELIEHPPGPTEALIQLMRQSLEARGAEARIELSATQVEALSAWQGMPPEGRATLLGVLDGIPILKPVVALLRALETTHEHG